MFHSDALCVSSTFSPPEDSRTDANRFAPPTPPLPPPAQYGRWFHPAINKLLATLTSAFTELAVEHVLLLLHGQNSAGFFFYFHSLFPPFLPLSPFQTYLNVFSPPLESAVHLAPQIAYDSNAISSRGFELNWSEQYHLCLLKGRSGSHCCSTERNWVDGGGDTGGGGARGAKKLLPATIKASVSHAICPAGSPVREGLLQSRAGCLLLSLSPLLHPLSPSHFLQYFPLSSLTLYLP